ncbi:MAG: spore germination protein [Firmicutes bacterium]|nr:spore germination protein [Bacillota bacterium]
MARVLNEGRVGTPEVYAMTIILLSGKIFLALPQQMAKLGTTAGWMIVAVATVAGLAGFGIIAALMRRFPDHSIVEVSEQVAGTFFGLVASLAFFAFFLALTIIILRQFTETVISTVLPQTPISIVTAIFVIALVFGCYQGLEAITRLALLASPFLLLGAITILLMSMPFANFDYLFPFWGVGLPKVLTTGVKHSAFMSEILILPLIYPALRDHGRFTSIGLGSVSVSGVLMALYSAQLLAVFSVAEASRSAFPAYQLARLIWFGRFVQRVESVFIFMWVLTGLLQMTIALYGATVTLSRLLHLSVYRPLLPAMGIIVYTLGFVPPNFPTIVRLDTEIIHVYGSIVSFGIPLILLVIAWFRGQAPEGRGGAEPQKERGAPQGRRKNA